MEKEKTVLEDVQTAQSLQLQQKGGADRIELCSNLIIGGTTPDTKMYRIIQNEAGIPARILIRPRFGDFCYSKYEKELILEQIQAFREEGAQGVVIGALLPDGSFDLEFMEECMKAAGNCKVTCHRAFDMCRDPFEALEALIKPWCGHIVNVWTGAISAGRSKIVLKHLQQKAEGRIHIFGRSRCVR